MNIPIKPYITYLPNILKELKLALNNCYDNVSLSCGKMHVYTVYMISTKIRVILTKDNININIINFLFIPEHFEIISNGHKTLSSMVSFIRQMDNNT